MKCSIKILFSILLLTGIFTSCVKDKGSYDYTYIEPLEVAFVKDSIIISNGAVLNLTPIFRDVTTGSEVNVNYDDYTYEWHTLEFGKINTKDRKLVSDKYDLNASIVLPITTDYHTIYFKAINAKTNQTYISLVKVRTTSAFLNSYMFLTEDDSQNVELEIYGWDQDKNLKHLKNYLSATDFPYTTGGANAIEFDKVYNRLFIATGSGMSWLNTPDFAYNSTTNDIKHLLIPTTTHTFSTIIRLGNTSTSGMSRTFMCFTETGELNVINNVGAQPSISLRGAQPVEVSPMVAANHAQQAVLLWDNTNKEVTFASMAAAGMAIMSRSLSPYDTGISAKLKECLFMGGSTDRPLIAVVKDVNNTIWRVDAKSFSLDGGFMEPYYAQPLRDPKELIGTASLGQIDHWICSREKGYIYAIVGNTMYTYVESQAGGVTDPGWTRVNITDDKGATVTISDPISFVWSANNGTTDKLGTCFYIVTYSEANGGTVYRLNPREVGSEIEFLEKFTGLGNVKAMCYWWG